MLFISLHVHTLNVDVRFLGFDYMGLSINRAILLFFTAAFLSEVYTFYTFCTTISIIPQTRSIFNCQRHRIFKASTPWVPLFHRHFLTTRVDWWLYAITAHDYNTNHVKTLSSLGFKLTRTWENHKTLRGIK